MVAFCSSCEDEHDDMIITLLLLAASDIAINKMPLFSDCLTADKVRRRKRQNPVPDPTASIVKSVLDFVQQQAQ